jgi:hypothetical protein
MTNDTNNALQAYIEALDRVIDERIRGDSDDPIYDALDHATDGLRDALQQEPVTPPAK